MALKVLSCFVLTWATLVQSGSTSCEGNANCGKVGDGHALQLIHDAMQIGVNGGNGDFQFIKAEPIACQCGSLGSVCAYYKNDAGGSLYHARDSVQRLIQHGCKACGKMPFEKGLDELVVAYTETATCCENKSGSSKAILCAGLDSQPDAQPNSPVAIVQRAPRALPAPTGPTSSSSHSTSSKSTSSSVASASAPACQNMDAVEDNISRDLVARGLITDDDAAPTLDARKMLDSFPTTAQETPRMTISSTQLAGRALPVATGPSTHSSSSHRSSSSASPSASASAPACQNMDFVDDMISRDLVARGLLKTDTTAATRTTQNLARALPAGTAPSTHSTSPSTFSQPPASSAPACQNMDFVDDLISRDLVARGLLISTTTADNEDSTPTPTPLAVRAAPVGTVTSHSTSSRSSAAPQSSAPACVNMDAVDDIISRDLYKRGLVVPDMTLEAMTKPPQPTKTTIFAEQPIIQVRDFTGEDRPNQVIQIVEGPDSSSEASVPTPAPEEIVLPSQVGPRFSSFENSTFEDDEGTKRYPKYHPRAAPVEEDQSVTPRRSFLEILKNR